MSHLKTGSWGIDMKAAGIAIGVSPVVAVLVTYVMTVVFDSQSSLVNGAVSGLVCGGVSWFLYKRLETKVGSLISREVERKGS